MRVSGLSRASDPSRPSSPLMRAPKLLPRNGLAPDLRRRASFAATPLSASRTHPGVGGHHDCAEHEADRLADSALDSRPPLSTDSSRNLPTLLSLEHSRAPEAIAPALRSPGEPLAPEARRLFEPRFGHNFASVRVHTDREAARSAQAIGARAWAWGPHLGFASDAYRPSELDGQRLLAHELAHVIQSTRPGEQALVRRFGTGEHVMFGEIAGKQEETQINGVTIKYGELIALGDFFATIDDVYREPKDKLQALVDAVRRSAAGVPVGTDEWERLTDGRYLTLATNNASHFSPSNAAVLPAHTGVQPDNRSSYEQYHSQALAAAKAGQMDRAMAINGFADHFLTDAFAAGHLVNKTDVAAAFSGSLAGSKDAFIRAVAASVWSNGRVRTAFAKWQCTTKGAFATGYGRVFSVDSMAGLLGLINWKRPEIVPNAAVLSLHNKLNAEGVEVQNAVSASSWVTYGDSNLQRAPETLDMGRQAVAASQAEVRAAAQGKVASAPFTEVWKYVPQATKSGPNAGEQTLAREARVFTDVSNPETIRAIAETTIDQVDTIIDNLHTMGVLEPANNPAKTLPPDFRYAVPTL